ncbi:TonB-dependent receptor [Salisaeta longa]|uniref:TonB-dependent receptor n=1 Tax=Salisaeta longa TaxID=503170 RepID=UPI0006862FEF|nr:TonB-dependent receptor [Salisaeta longa]
MRTFSVFLRFLTCFLVLATVSVCSSYAQTSATLAGVVTGANDGAPLIGANVVLRTPGDEVVRGASTDVTGAYALANIPPGSYVLEVSYIGYQRRTVPVTLEAGEQRTLDVALPLATSGLETVVVSVSRRQERLLNAPASISVLEAEEFQQQSVTSSVEALQPVAGVDMAQTGIDRREVALRGFNQAFNGATYVLTDYREAAVPSLNVNAFNVMPALPIDLERVEVVRGPGSALYGPGVDAGVVHFFTKDPFDYPGTTVAVSGGQRSYFAGQFRQAGVISEQWGYKFTGQYAQGQDWQLNPNNPADAAEISRYAVFEERSQVGDRPFATVDGKFQLRRDDDYYKYNVNGTLQYRPNDITRITAKGGYGETQGVFQSGVGTLQVNGFGYTYGQLRVRSGGLFGQVFVNRNHNTGDTYILGSGRYTTDESLQWSSQLRYNFLLERLDTDVTVGGDINLLRPRTAGTVTGRFEDQDAIDLYGAYAQSTSTLANWLDLTVAVRGDYDNLQEEVKVSPRAALVFRLNADNTLRATYNRSFSAPGTNSNFLDVRGQTRALGKGFNLAFQGLGAVNGFTFDSFRQNGTVRFSLPGPAFGAQVGIGGLPVAPMYGLVANQAITVNSQGQAQFVGGLFSNLSDQQRALLANIFGFTATNGLVGGATDAAVLGIPDGSARGYRTVNAPSDIPPLQQTETQSMEVGYKGLLGGKLLVSLDGYYEQKKNFIGPLRIESPLAYLQANGLSQDVGGVLGTLFTQTSNTTLNGLLDQLAATGIPRQQAAQLLAGLVGQSLNNTPAAVVQPDQQVLAGSDPQTVGGFLTYRNFGEVQYWGIDAALQYTVTPELDLFTNISYVSDDFFTNEELEETDTSLNVALNAPSFKLKSGFDYMGRSGFSFGLTGRYIQGFPVATGPYVGRVDDYFVMDAYAGYAFQESVPGLKLKVTANNVFDHDHREFVGAPALGRFIIGQLTYTLP